MFSVSDKMPDELHKENIARIILTDDVLLVLMDVPNAYKGETIIVPARYTDGKNGLTRDYTQLSQIVMFANKVGISYIFQKERLGKRFRMMCKVGEFA